MKIAITGSGGIGKTTLGKALAKQLGVAFLEEDIQHVVSAANALCSSRLPGTPRDQRFSAEQQYAHACEEWLNRRIDLQRKHPAGFVADRWALDIFQRWLFIGAKADDDATTRIWLNHIKTQSTLLDLIVIPPFNTCVIEQINDQGLQRNKALASRLLSHSLYRGLLEQLTTTKKLYLSEKCNNLSDWINQVITSLESKPEAPRPQFQPPQQI